MEFEFWESSSGKYPAIEFMNNFSDRDYNHLKEQLDKYEQHLPNELFKDGKIKKIDDDLFRIKINKVRFLACKRGQSYVIVHGFVKKTNKIPQKEKEIAKNRINQII